MSNQRKKTFWPWGIVLGIIGVIIMSVGTVIFALNHPVQMENDHLAVYQDVDKQINKLITDNIAFKNTYDLNYKTEGFEANGTAIVYSITTKEGVGVNDAVFEAVLTRPDEIESNIVLKVKDVSNGVYTFDEVTLNKLGRWNLFVNVSVGTLKGFERLKLDTRYPKTTAPFDIATVMN